MIILHIKTLCTDKQTNMYTKLKSVFGLVFYLKTSYHEFETNELFARVMGNKVKIVH